MQRLRSPAEYYFRALIVHPRKYTNEDIKERCFEYDLDFIGPTYIDRLREHMRPPEFFYPDDRNHTASFHYIIEQKLLRFFQRDLAMRTCLELVDNTRAKEFVETMLIVRVPIPAICSYVIHQEGIYLTADALALFTHYFWNIKKLTTNGLRLLLAARYEKMEEQVAEFKGMGKLLKSAYYRDPRKIAADLPHCPTTAVLAQMRLGIKPGKSELAHRLIEARDYSALRAIESAMQDGPGDSQKFLNYVNGSRILEELLQMAVKPEDEMKEQLQAIALRTDTVGVPSIHQLSGGQHTVDVSPMKELDHDDESGIDPAGSGSNR